MEVSLLAVAKSIYYYFTQPRPQGAFSSKATEKRPGKEVVFYP